MSKPAISFEPWLCSWPDSTKQGQGFPRRFWPLWCMHYRREPMLHLFCGSSEEGETRVDIRKGTGANLVGSFDEVSIIPRHASAFADPPYTPEFAAEWGAPYPKPSAILKVMRDAVMPGGIVGVLHLQVLRPVAGLEKVAWHPVFTGTTKHIRCLSVFRREQ